MGLMVVQDPVIHSIPGSAYALLLKVYNILNDGKEIAETVKPAGKLFRVFCVEITQIYS